MNQSAGWNLHRSQSEDTDRMGTRTSLYPHRPHARSSPFEVSYFTLSVILLHRGVHVGVVCTGNNVIHSKVKWSHNGLEQCVDGVIMEQLCNDGARPVRY